MPRLASLAQNDTRFMRSLLRDPSRTAMLKNSMKEGSPQSNRNVIASERGAGDRIAHAKGIPRLASLARNDTQFMRSLLRDPSRTAMLKNSMKEMLDASCVIPSERSESRDPLRMCDRDSL